MTVETEAGTLALRDPQDVREHPDLFEHFRGRSLKGQECRDCLALVAADFRAS